MPSTPESLNNQFDRRVAWKPSQRPEWVARINQEGDHLDIENVIPLDEESLLAGARRATGLDDFGDDEWSPHFRVLLKSIAEEAQLNFLGRIYARSELLFYLGQRLQVIDWYKKHPEINEQEIKQPIWIMGLGRCGTTIFHEVLSQDPQFRTPKHWEGMFPAPPSTADASTDPRIEIADKLVTLPDRITPEFRSMHALNADLPCDDTEVTYSSFLSEIWYYLFQIPSYVDYLNQQQDYSFHFEWHTKILKLLQSGYMKSHWLLKNPPFIDRIPEVVETYPDARFIFMHRDPIVSADSVTNIMGTIYWRATDNPWSVDMISDGVLAEGRAQKWEKVIGWIEEGSIAPGSYTNVHYKELCERPLDVIKQVYEELGLSPTPGALERMEQYLKDKPKGVFGKHNYKAGEGGQAVIDAERKRYQRYQDYFGVVSEI